MDFAIVLKSLMDSKGLSNYQLAKDLDVHPSTIANWLAGKRPRKKTLLQISEYFDVSVDYLLGNLGKENAPAKTDGGALEDDIKFALFGGDGEITDAMYEEVKRFARMVKLREEAENKGK